MKKALVVFLILAVAGGLFAQWSGSVTTGALFTFGDEITVDASDDDGHAVKARLSYASSGDDYGVSVGVNGDRTTGNADAGYYIDSFSGWVSFADMFRLTAGRSVGGNWRINDFVSSNIPGSGAGVRLNITPISGLNFGFVFGYPTTGVKAGTIANFFQETGIGANYNAGIFQVGTSLKLFSEESDGYPDTDANWWIDVLVPVPNLFNAQLSAKILNLFAKKAAQDKLVGLKLSGSVVGLSWNVWGKAMPNDTLTAIAGAGVSYPITINDKTSLGLDANANLTVLEDFNFDSWDASAKVTYKFNDKVSTSGKFKLAQNLVAETFTPTLLWNIGYSF
jgi:hypothetical protein